MRTANLPMKNFVKPHEQHVGTARYRKKSPVKGVSQRMRKPYILLRTLLGLFALASTAALIGSNSAQISTPTPVPMRVLADPNQLSLEHALAQLREQPLRQTLATERATHDFWMLLDLNGLRQEHAQLLTIHDKYLRNITVWLLDEHGNPTSKTVADRSLAADSGPLLSFDGGYAWRLEASHPPAMVVRTDAVGAAKLRAGLISETQFRNTKLAKERLASGVTAALTSVAFLIGVIGALAGSSALAICAIWVSSLWLVTAISLGYDLMWLPVQLPAFVETAVKQIILVAFAASTFAYFLALFWRQVARAGHLHSARKIARIGFGASAVGALFIPNAVFMPPFWLLVLSGLSYMTWIVATTLLRKPSQAARAFAYLWGLISLCILAEISYVSGWIERIPGLSFETGAVFGALLAAYGAAGIFRVERIRSFGALLKSRHATKRYRRMYRGVPVGLLTLNESAKVIAYNRLAAELLSAPMIRSLSLAELIGDAAAAQLSERMTTQAPGNSFHFETKIHSRDKARILHLHAIPETGGTVQIAITDFSVHAELEDTLRRQLTHDPLTGVLSYMGLERKLSELEESITGGLGVQYACIHLNLDNFSAINDVFGRNVGDEVLRETVRRIGFELSTTEFHIARPGADDFIVMIKCSSLHWTRRMAELLVSSIGSHPVNVDGVDCRTTSSAGIAFLLDGIPVHEVLDQAQRACSSAKHAGGDQISVFDTSPSSMERYRAERSWESLATSDELLNTLEIWAQPIVPLLDPDAPIGLEVLLRVRHNGEPQSPMLLIEAATKVGRMPIIDRWVLKSVVDLMRDDQRLFERIDFLTVNLSGASLNSHSFVDDMRSLLHSNYLHCSKLCIEITEQVALVDVRATQRLVEELRMFGVQIGLDDFGAGNTSFAYLRDLNADILKMDGAYVRNMEKDAANAKLVQGIAGLSRTFGMACIAEWIEHEDTARLCAEFGIEYGQGYLFARPQPILDWLDGKASLDDSRALFLKEDAKPSKTSTNSAKRQVGS